VPDQHGVEVLLAHGRCRGVTGEEHRVTTGEFGPGQLHHGRGEVDAGDAVPLLGREE
jgi:hypothetical protein